MMAKSIVALMRLIAMANSMNDPYVAWYFADILVLKNGG